VGARAYAAAMARRSDFARPNPLWFLLLDGGIALLVTTYASEPAYEAVNDVVPLPPKGTLKALLAVTAVLHVGEALVARRSAKRHGLPVGRWTRQTFVVGFPSLLAMRKVRRAG